MVAVVVGDNIVDSIDFDTKNEVPGDNSANGHDNLV